MRQHVTSPSSLLVLLLLLALAPRGAAQDVSLQFAEDFALADDRAAVLEQLIPGSPAANYYRCLLLQNEGHLHEVDDVLATWIARGGRTPRVVEIENRQALLRFGTDPDVSYAFLRQRLGLRFDQRPQVAGAAPDLPSVLDPDLFSRQTLTRRALSLHPGTVEGIAGSGLAALLDGPLDDDLLMSLLRRLERPDHPGLPALIVRNLKHRLSRGFGSLSIHQDLLLDQLEECARLMPGLLDDAAFVQAMLKRLQPPEELGGMDDPVARADALERLEAFTRRLSPAHNSLKAHVLFHRLDSDRRHGVYDKARLLDYLRLPRQGGRRDPKLLTTLRSGASAVDVTRSFPTGLPPIGDDQDLVEGCLQHFFRAGEPLQTFAGLLEGGFLRRLFAETHILYGLGDPERWYSLLDDPQAYEELRDRVEVAFAPTRTEHFGREDLVSIDVDLKHVDTLRVKIFEIDAFGFYTEQQREVDGSVDLTGLVPNREMVQHDEVNPLRRVRRHFEFPSLREPGVYVLEFVGNGVASRAVIRKGGLRFVQRPGAAGHVFRIFDEQDRLLRDASLWLDGRLYGADADGEISVPYSSEAGSRSVVLVRGEQASLGHFLQLAESAELGAGVFVEREALRARGKARLLLRPDLLINGEPASVSLLEHPVVHIAAWDHDGVVTRLDVADVELSDTGEWVHELSVPDALDHLVVFLGASLPSVTGGEDLELSSQPVTLRLNVIDTEDDIASVLLGRDADGWRLDVLGKAGEPLAGHPLELVLVHRDFRDPLKLSLSSDLDGRVRLGPLPGLESLRVEGMPHGFDTWHVGPKPSRGAERVCGLPGELLKVPYHGRAAKLDRSVASLLELRGEVFVRDWLDHARLAGGFVELRELPAGHYELWLEEEQRGVELRVTPGRRHGDWIVGPHELLPGPAVPPAHITSLALEDDQLVLRLADAGPDARVHLIATRWLPAVDPLEALSVPAWRPDDPLPVRRTRCEYAPGRTLSDEFRYILERRDAPHFPGNMLERPSLLLDPWALEQTVSNVFTGRTGNDVIGVGGAGGGFGGRAYASAHASGQPISPALFANLDFLPDGSVTLPNLRPDKTGVLRVALAELGAGHLVQALVLDGRTSEAARLVLPERPWQPRRLGPALPADPSVPVSEQRRLLFVDAGEVARIDDPNTSRQEVYDSLESVFRLFKALGHDDNLARFQFLAHWPELSRDEQLAKYSEFACHELNLFLHEKDRPFFDQVVAPFLASKLHPTFLDHWLLDDDLRPWLEPWAFSRLNTMEQVLLARRLPEALPGVSRQLAERVDLIPPDPAEARRRFEVALAGAALQGGSKTGARISRTLNTGRRGATIGSVAPSESAAAPPPDSYAEDAIVEESALNELGYTGGARAAGASGSLTGRARKLAKDVARRAEQRMLWHSPDATREWVENDYWHVRVEDQGPALVAANAFWLDYARAAPGTPFVSPHLLQATGNLTEMLAALALTDLPFQAGEHALEQKSAGLELRAASPLLLVVKELAPAPEQEQPPTLLLSQNIYRLGERYGYDGNRRFDRFLGDELLVGVGYASDVVVTNPTGSPLSLELLMQVPSGAIPVSAGFFTHGVDLTLEAYQTRRFENAFYLPHTGSAPWRGAVVTQQGALVAAAASRRLRVVREPSTVDQNSWEYVSQQGSLEQVLAFLRETNLQRVDLTRMAWRMRDRAAFDAVIGLLRARHVTPNLLWSFGLLHGDLASSREYLEQRPDFVARCGWELHSPLLDIDPVSRHAYQHVEYLPLINARAHRFGEGLVVPDENLASQYRRLLDVLAQRPRLDDADWLEVTYYLLLQDRLAEALDSFARVDPDRIAMRLQYDATAAWLAFSRGDVAEARRIAESYAEHPVLRWRRRFAEMLTQLDEIEGRPVAGGGDADRLRQLTELADAEPELWLTVAGGQVELHYQNLERCELRYTPMDIEFLFSTDPFLDDVAEQAAPIRPARRDEISLPQGSETLVLDLPPEFASTNLIVEARAGGKMDRDAYTANRLSVKLVEAYGQLTVAHAEGGAPMPGVYVKVYVKREDGSVAFHKDGYTDLRGRFDYASISASEGAAPERFAILVLSDQDGAEVREVDAPAR